MSQPVDIVEQIKVMVQDSGEFTQVLDSVDLSLLTASDIRGAANANAWVGEVSSDPEPAGLAGVQLERQVYGVVIGVRAINDPKGDTVRSILRQKRHAVRKALFDQAPLNGYLAFELAGSSQVKFVNGALFYIERFRTQKIITKDSLL